MPSGISIGGEYADPAGLDRHAERFWLATDEQRSQSWGNAYQVCPRRQISPPGACRMHRADSGSVARARRTQIAGPSRQQLGSMRLRPPCLAVACCAGARACPAISRML